MSSRCTWRSRRGGLLLAAAALWPLAGCGAPAVRPLLHADFERDPLKDGWSFIAPKGEETVALWMDHYPAREDHCIAARRGEWLSPPFPVAPFQWYSVRLTSLAEGNGYCGVLFYDAEGTLLQADHYSSIPASREWEEQTFFFRGKAGAVEARLRLAPIGGKLLLVDGVRVREAGREEVAEWADALRRSMPPLAWTPPADRWRHLRRTRSALEKRGTLRIVLLGDSIANDTGCAPFDVLLERLYPGARVEVVTSVRSGTGCQYYQQEDRVAEYVLPFEPDLLIIGGISNGRDVKAIRSVIHQVRSRSQPEVLLLTGAFGWDGWPGVWLGPEHWRPPPGALEEYAQRLKQLAEEEQAGFLDVRAATWDYLKASGRPYEWFLRDPIHPNDRGRQLLARILETYFAPIP